MISIDELLETRFTHRPMEDKVKIVRAGRPRPPMDMQDNSTLRTYLVEKTAVRVFQLADYDTFPWVAGNFSRRKLYCWPCLLFSKEDVKWSADASADGSSLYDPLKKHENEEHHIQYVLKLQTFIHDYCIPQGEESLGPPLHNELVKRNREIIKRLIDIIFSLISQQKPRDADSCNKIRIEDCIQGLELLKHHDSHYSEHLDDAVQLLRIEPKIVPDLLNAMCRTYFDIVKKETKLSTYVSLILSEHSEIVTEKSLVSAVLRYFRAGKICERFVGYLHVNEHKSQNLMTTRIIKFVQDCDISDRLIALAVDGGVAPSAELDALVRVFYSHYPYSFFLPWCSHKLDHVLLQSLYHMDMCAMFFKYIKKIGHFFQKNSIRRAALEEFMCTAFPSLRNLNWYKKSQLPKILHTYRVNFIEFFQNFPTHCPDYSSGDFILALSFCDYLKTFEAIFLLEVFVRVFDHTSTLNVILRSESPESFFGSDVVADVIAVLTEEKEKGFDLIWSLLFSLGLTPKDPEPSPKSVPGIRFIPRAYFQEKYKRILQCIIGQIRIRFEFTKRLTFFNMLNCDGDGRLQWRETHIDQLLEVHQPFFLKGRVTNEVKAIQDSPDFRGKSVYELLESLHKMNLSTAVKDVFKIACMILTVPTKPPSASGTACKLKDIQMNFRPSDVPEISYNLSIIRTELDFFQKLRKEVFFYDSVIFKFREKNDIMELMFK